MYKKSLAIVLLVGTTSINAMFKKSIQGISRANYKPEQIKFLVDHAKKFLTCNHSKIVCQQNESGFVRFNIPAPEGYKADFEKMRLNFWPNKAQSSVALETIHSHPRAFDSIIMSGGYIHGIYEEDSQDDAPIYDRYRIYKPSLNEKKMMFVGHSKVKHLEDQEVSKGACIHIPTSSVHRVITTNPQTISLNMVTKNLKGQEYDVYLTPGSCVTNVKTERNFLSEYETSLMASDAIYLMENFEKEL